MKTAKVFLLGLVVVLLIAVPDMLSQKRSSVGKNNYITGRITARTSTPTRSVWVILYDGATEKGRSLTGDDGRYYIGNLEQKSYAIVVRRQLTGADLVRNQVSLPANRIYNMRLP